MRVKTKDDVERIKESYSELSEIEIHAFNMKREGTKDEVMKNGGKRPIVFLWNHDKFVLSSFMFHAEDSPYRIEGEHILFDEQQLPFNDSVYIRLGNVLPYWYFRGPLGLFPTMNLIAEERNVLNTNFRPKCSGCDFCFYGYRAKDMKNLTVDKGYQIVEEESGIKDLSIINQISIVTGRFPSEKALKDYTTEIIQKGRKRGWKGRIFYIGSQFVTPEIIEEVINELGDPKKFRYAYTVERFTDRNLIMHGNKGQKDAEEILEDMKRIEEMGITPLEYTYIVGIENLDSFKKWAEKFVPFSKPHISLLRRTGIDSNELSRCNEYEERGVEYIADMRRHWLDLYGSEILGNNYANAWPFQLDFDINQYLKKDKTCHF